MFNPLTLQNVLSHSLHLIFRILAGGGTSVLGFIDPSVPTCNGVRLRTVCSCRTSRALPFCCVLLVDDGEKPLLEPCFLSTGFVTNVFAVLIDQAKALINLSVAMVSDCD